MRLFALFFSFYLTCLSCLPCADEAVQRLEPGQTTVAATSHSNDHRQALGDWCSPLCQCHCCGGAVVPPSAPVAWGHTPLPVWGLARNHAPLLVAAASQPARAVWQPPQA